MKLPFFSLSFIPLLLLPYSTTLAQSPAQSPTSPSVTALPPALPGPTNLTKILEKSGQFNILIRLLKNTQVGEQVNKQLNDSNDRITIFAPTDNAFANLKSGTLNSLTDQEKVQLLQFHILPNYLSLSNFQTVSNPVRTQVGDDYEFPLNVTTSGSSVNISTGLVNTTITGTVYTDGQLAVYQVDSVLKPLGIFDPKPQPPAPAPEKPKKSKAKALAAASPKTGPKNDDSGASNLIISNGVVSIGGVVGLVAALILL